MKEFIIEISILSIVTLNVDPTQSDRKIYDISIKKNSSTNLVDVDWRSLQFENLYAKFDISDVIKNLNVHVFHFSLYSVPVEFSIHVNSFLDFIEKIPKLAFIYGWDEIHKKFLETIVDEIQNI